MAWLMLFLSYCSQIYAPLLAFVTFHFLQIIITWNHFSTMVEVIRGTDNSLTLAVLVGAWVFPTSRNHSRVGSDTFLRFWNCLLLSLVPFHAHLLRGCWLLIACVPPHVDVTVDSWSQHSLHHIFVPQWPHRSWHLLVCWWASVRWRATNKIF